MAFAVTPDRHGFNAILLRTNYRVLLAREALAIMAISAERLLDLNLLTFSARGSYAALRRRAVLEAAHRYLLRQHQA